MSEPLVKTDKILANFRQMYTAVVQIIMLFLVEKYFSWLTAKSLHVYL